MNSAVAPSPSPLRSAPAATLLATFLAVLLAGAGPADAVPWERGLEADPSVPSPDEFLGRTFAERHTTVDEIQAYCRALAESSDRVRLEEIGESVLGEPLFLLSVADPGRREELARRGERLAVVRDPWEHDRDERRAAASAMLPVVWVACSVHGDEASGADAGVALAYRLAADRSEATRRILETTVVVIDPLQNPDGRRRFLQHVRSFGHTERPDPSPWAAEHNQLWPGGRTNHFLFDMNRDWAFQTQPETRARVAAVLRWRPQVFIDLHEMNRRSSYFFPPPSEPINPNVPESTLEWFDAFGRANARAFEDEGYDYFVRETFDLFYPGYGDSWPTLLGAVGMTYEQASTRGRALRQRGGRIVGYREAVARHYVAARATIGTASRNHRELMASVVDFYEIARRRSQDDERRELVLSVRTRRGEARRLAALLHRQGIDVREITEDARLDLRVYDRDEEQRVELPAGSLRVPLRQADYGLLRSLLDPHTPLAERFLAQERERRRRGLRNRFYDVTAWSLVYGYGVEAFYSTDSLDDLPSRPFDPERRDEGMAEVLSADVAYAWIFPFEDNGALECLPDLWRAGVRVACAQSQMRLEGHDYPRGSLVIPRHANSEVEGLAETLETIARRHGVRLRSTRTGWSESGPALGSSRISFLEQPRIGLLTGPGLSPLSAGAQAWLLEHRYGVDYTAVLLETLGRVDLRDFDVLVLPEKQRSASVPVEALRPWVESGGLLVAVGRSVPDLLDGEEPFGTVEVITDLAELADEEGRLGEVEVGRVSTDEEMAVLPDDRRPLSTPGAILRVELDPTHPLTLGPEGPSWVPYLSDRLLRPSIAGKNVVIVDGDAPRAAGFMWPVMEEAVRGKAFLVEEKVERGRVVLFAEDPAFRGVWEGIHRLFLNAVLLRSSLMD